MSVNVFLWFAATLVCGHVALAAEPVGLQLQDGSRLTGEMQVSDTGGLSLDSYWMEHPMKLEVQDIKHLRMDGAEVKRPRGTRVELAGGSQMWLESMSVTDSELSGLTHWGERIALAHQDLQQVFLSSVNRARYRTDLTETESSPFNWRNNLKGGLRPNQIIPHVYDIFDWPEKFYLEVMLEAPIPSSGYHLLCTGPNPDTDSRFLVRVNANVATVLITEPRPDGLIRPRYINVPLQPAQSINRLRIVGNLSTGEMRMRIGEGEMVAWTIEDDALFQSTLDRPASLLIQDVRTGDSVKPSHVTLVPWEEGSFPDLPMSQPGITLFSGERIHGEVQAMESRKVHFQADGSERLQTLDQDEIFVWAPSPRSIDTGSRPFARVKSQVSGESYHFRTIKFLAGTESGAFGLSGEFPSGARLVVPAKGFRSVSVDASFSSLMLEQPGDARPVFVRMLNGDTLYGRFQGITGDSLLLQTGSEKDSEVVIHAKAVETLQFHTPIDSSDGSYQFWLTDGARMVGDLLSLSEQHLKARTRWADDLTIRRRVLQRVARRPEGQTSTSLLTPDYEGWTFEGQTYEALSERPDIVQQSPTGWVLKPGEYFYTSEPVEPGYLELEFQAEAEDSFTSGQMHFEMRGFYDPDGRERRIRLGFNSRRIRASIYDQGQSMQRWSGYMSEESSGRLRIHIMVNRQSEILRIEVGEQYTWEYPIGDWTFNSESAPLKVLLTLFDGAEELSVRRLRLMTGSDRPLPDVSARDKLPGTLLFLNGDRMQADVEVIDEDGAHLRLDNGVGVKMPLKRLFHFTLPESEPFELRRKAAHARFVLHDGEEEFMAEVLTADSEAFLLRREGVEGEFRIPVVQISRVDLNPYFLR